MKKILTNSMLLIAIVLCNKNYTSAQEEGVSLANNSLWTIGARGGISIPNLSSGTSGNPVNSGYMSGMGPDFSLLGEYHFSKLFSLEAMAEYSSQGGMKNGMQAFSTPGDMAAMFPPGNMPQYLYADYKSQAKLNYLMVPILAKVGWNLGQKEKFRLYVDAGPFIGFLIYAHNVTSGSSNIFLDAAGQQPVTQSAQSFSSDNNVKSQLNTVNFGISGNVGLAYGFGRNSVFIEGGGNYGFLNIQKGSQNGNNETGAATAMVGYSYGFGQRGQVKAKKE